MNNSIKLEMLVQEFPPFVRKKLLGLDISETSKIAYGYTIKAFLIYVSKKIEMDIINLSVNDLDDESIISNYLDYIEHEDITKTTYANRVKVLKIFFDDMYDSGMISFKYDFPIIKRRKYSVQYTEQDYKELIGVADAISNNLNSYVTSRNIERDKLIYVLLYEMGLKTAECVALKISDVDLEKWIVRVNRFNETYIKLNKKCYALLMEYYQVRQRQGITREDPLLINQQKTALTSRSIENIIESITRDIDDRLMPATLRLLCGAKRYIKTGDLMNVAQYLGIKYPTAEDRYICIKHTSNNSVTLRLEM